MPRLNPVPLSGGRWVTVAGVQRWEPPPKSLGKYTRKPLTLSPEEIRRGYSQYRQGSRTEFAVTAHREYQRIWRRNRTAARLATIAEKTAGRPV